MAVKSRDLQKTFSLLIDSQRRQKWEGKPLWPDEFLEWKPDQVYRFITTKCFSLDEATQPAREKQIPERAHLRYLVEKAHYCRHTPINGEWGVCTPDITIKGRRLVWTWTHIALNVWEAGAYPGGFYLWGGVTVPKTGDFVWRFYFIYNKIVKENPEWGLPLLVPSKDTKSVRGPRCLSSVFLPNGSRAGGETMDEPERFMSEGTRRVIFEELGKAPYPALCFQNATEMCKPPYGLLGGNVSGIATAMPGWLKLQRDPAGEVLGYYPAW